MFIGVGNPGSAACSHISAIDIGEVSIVDCNIFEVENLKRQAICLASYASDIEKSKISSANANNSINPNLAEESYFDKFTNLNAHNIVEKYDFIIDATDGFVENFSINDICVGINNRFSYIVMLKYQE